MSFPEEDDSHAGTPVFLNVYDLHPFNKYVYWMGLGAFHAGVEVNGVEWSFGFVSGPGTGVFQCEPRKAPGATYRETIPIGYTSKSGWQIDNVIAEMRISYRGCDYHMHLHNCIDFSADLAKVLTGATIPKWLSRLPHIAYAIRCCLPEAYRGPYPVGFDVDDSYSGVESSSFNERSALIAPPRGDSTSQPGIPKLAPPKAAKTLGINDSDDAGGDDSVPSSSLHGSEDSSSSAVIL